MLRVTLFNRLHTRYTLQLAYTWLNVSGDHQKQTVALANCRISLVLLSCVLANQKAQKFVLVGKPDSLYHNPFICHSLEGMSKSRLFGTLFVKAKCESVIC